MFAGTDRRTSYVIDPTARKVNWQEVGHVAEPGRYLFKFGWLTITAADIAIWQGHPTAAFTLVRVPGTAENPDNVTEEFHLGAIELRE